MGPWLIGIAGGSASGKSSLAQAVATLLQAQVVIVELDQYALTDQRYGPFTAPDLSGQTYFDLNHPDSRDWPRILAHLDELSAANKAKFIVVEGNFALYSPELRRRLSLGVFVLTPDDVRLGRKIIRNHRERGQDPATTFQNYLNSGRPGHDLYVAGTLKHADLILNGEKAVTNNAALLIKLMLAW